MSKNSENFKAGMPTAPPLYGGLLENVSYGHCPPPSYEDSQKMATATAQAAYYAPQHQQQLQPQQPQQFYYGAQQPTLRTYGPYSYVGATAMPTQQQMLYQQSYQQQQQPQFVYAPQLHYTTASVPMLASDLATKSNANVLTFAKGAKIRTSVTGTVNVPPPPPGYAPNAAQMAAMNGQPVVIKQQKKSFF